MKFLKKSSTVSNSFLRLYAVTIRNCTTETLRKGRKKTIYNPLLSKSTIQAAKNVVGVHVGSNSISWVKIEVNGNEITNLDTINFPINFEKMDLCELSSFAFHTFQMLPKASHYVMEESVRTVGSTVGRQQLILQSSRLQYIAMLVTLFNYFDESKTGQNAVFLKYRLTARLFGLLLGSEIVSSSKVVNGILSQEISSRFTPVKMSLDMKSLYNNRNRIQREIINQAMLVALTFLELVVYQNVKCSEFVGLVALDLRNKKSKHMK